MIVRTAIETSPVYTMNLHTKHINKVMCYNSLVG